MSTSCNLCDALQLFPYLNAQMVPNGTMKGMYYTVKPLHQRMHDTEDKLVVRVAFEMDVRVMPVIARMPDLVYYDLRCAWKKVERG